VNDQPQQFHAATWTDGALQELPGLSEFACDATGLSSDGRIAGSCNTEEFVSHACLWRAGQPVDLGTLGGTNSYAVGINAAGTVVGFSDLSTGVGGGDAAFVYMDGQMYDLNQYVRLPAGWTLIFGDAINDAGQILATASAPDGSVTSVVLTPDAR
jgi:probable HAF family extracellular repeat protein